MGFEIYNLRRFIGRSFDVYFHLWSNGALHWKREKRLWEEEERKLWSTVLSKRQKRAVKRAEAKKVRFARNLVCSSSKFKSVPSEIKHSVRIGSIELDISATASKFTPSSCTGIRKKCALEEYAFISIDDGVDLGSSDAISDEHRQVAEYSSHHDHQCSIVGSGEKISNFAIVNSNLNPGNKSFAAVELVKRARRLGGCTRCFSLNHKCFIAPRSLDVPAALILGTNSKLV